MCKFIKSSGYYIHNKIFYFGSSWFITSDLSSVCQFCYNFAFVGKNLEQEKKLLLLAENQFGRKPKTPSDFNELLLAVFSATGRSMSLSTAKRIWGYVNYASHPSVATLTTLARYVGFRDWESFCLGSDSEDSNFLDQNNLLNDIRPGATVTLEWDPDKGCTLRHIRSNRFVVTKAHNIKLQPGDELTAELFSTGQPVYMKDILRGGQRIPIYIAAKKSGLKSIRFET